MFIFYKLLFNFVSFFNFFIFLLRRDYYFQNKNMIFVFALCCNYFINYKKNIKILTLKYFILNSISWPLTPKQKIFANNWFRNTQHYSRHNIIIAAFRKLALRHNLVIKSGILNNIPNYSFQQKYVQSFQRETLFTWNKIKTISTLTK